MFSENTYCAASLAEFFKENIKSTEFLLFCCFAVAAIIAIIVFIVLLSLRFKLTLVIDEKRTEKKSCFGNKRMEIGEPAPREGYRFCGWYEDEARTKRVGKVFRMPMRGATLYAKWEKCEEEELVKESDRTAEPPQTAEPVLAVQEEEQAAEPVSAEQEEEQAVEPVSVEQEKEQTVEPVSVEQEEEQAAEPVSVEQEETQQENAEIELQPTVEVEAEEVGESAAELPLEQEDAEQYTADDLSEDSAEESGEGDEVEGALVTTVSGGKVFVQYRRSFRARLIQAGDEMKEYYNALRSEMLSYIGTRERVSWNYDSYFVGRKQFAKINANAKSLIVYFALDPKEVDEKYKFRDVSAKKRYAAVPVRYKITGSRSFRYALELLEQTAAEFELDYKRVELHEDIPYETREALIAKKLIRVYAKRETGETVSEQQLEEMIAEGATIEALSSYTVTDKVTVAEAEDAIDDKTAQQIIALADSKSFRATGKRAVVNLDTISANFEEDDLVDIETLKEKGLIDKKAASVKVLARGMLDKSLTVEAADFSLAAVKMIALTGGKVVKLRRFAE